MNYDIFLQNNTSKEVFLMSGMTTTDDAGYYLHFADVDLPEGCQNGEYTYAVIYNDRVDVTYTLNNAELLKTTAYVAETDETFTLEQLSPIMGLMRADLGGENKPEPIYESGDTTNNNTVYYYEG